MPKIFSVLCKFIALTFGIIFILLVIAVLRAVLLQKERIPESCTSDDKDYISDSRGLSKRLSSALKFETISYNEHIYNREAISNYLTFITKTFPQIHSSPLVSREVVNNLSLLYYFEGSNQTLKPYLLAGHLDVVPVEESYWEVPPFSGQIKDGYIWGRGSIDCKHIVMGVLEAVEFLLEKGYTPQRSFYLAFGHDEETSGLDGAQHISNLLKSRNVTLEYILDEGTFVLDKVFPGVHFPVALIGISEKGYLNLELKVDDAPGHSSLPHKETAIVILAKALAKLEGNVFPSMFGKGPEMDMLEELAYCPVPFPYKVALGNMWLFKPFIPLVMNTPVMSALHRTTTAVTIVSGGNKINVIPSSASALVNIRLHPAQTIQQGFEFMRKVINDERVKLKVLSERSAHPISPTDTFGYSCIKKSIKQIYNDSCVLPTLLIANTDTRWYLDLSNSIYRFSLVRMAINETSRFHGHNERIAVENYVNLVNFFLHLIKNSDFIDKTTKHIHEDL